VPSKDSTSRYLLIGGVLAACVFAFFVVRAVVGSVSTPTGTCALASGAAEAIGAGLSRGHDEHEIASIAGAGALDGACEVAVKKWVDHPDEAVKVSLAGAPVISVTGSDFQRVLAKSLTSETAVPARPAVPGTNRDAGGWQSPVDLGGGQLGSAPAAGVDAVGDRFVFWRGTDGSLWDKWFVAGEWHGPGEITAAGKNLASPPTVAVHANGQQDVFWRGTDGALWELSHTSRWQTPVRLGGGQLGSAPAAGVDAVGDRFVFWRGTNNSLWDKWFVAGEWHGPGRINAAGLGISAPPTVAVPANGQQDVFWRGTDGKLWELAHVPGS
jgi:hypothetical protein